MNVYLGAFDPNKDYTGKFCLMFRFGSDDYGIPFAHCTHKFLGQVSELKLDLVQAAIETYWRKNYETVSTPQLWTFDKPERLGEKRDTPVLERSSYAGMLVRLKHMLDEVVPEKFPYYRPHVTVPEGFAHKAIHVRPVEYALMEGGKLINSWPMGHAAKGTKMSGKMRTLAHEFKPGAMQKSFGDRVDEEMQEREESKKLSDESTEGTGGSASGGNGDVQEVVPEPGEKTMAEMLQNPHDVLDQGASGDTSASGVKIPSQNPDLLDTKNVVDQDTVKKMGAPNRFASPDPQAIWDSVTKGAVHKHTACVNAMKGKVSDPHAYCQWLATEVGYKP